VWLFVRMYGTPQNEIRLWKGGYFSQNWLNAVVDPSVRVGDVGAFHDGSVQIKTPVELVPLAFLGNFVGTRDGAFC
jgi:hypothetical protein